MSPALLAETRKQLGEVDRHVQRVDADHVHDEHLREIIRRLESIEATLKVIAKHVLRDSGGGRR